MLVLFDRGFCSHAFTRHALASLVIAAKNGKLDR
jgi:hypothetical protein